MGSPIGSLLADVRMNHVVDKALDLTSPSHRPNFFSRYIDDCFATFPNPTSIDIFLTNLNNIHNQIQFTILSRCFHRKKPTVESRRAHITNLAKLTYQPITQTFLLFITNEI